MNVTVALAIAAILIAPLVGYLTATRRLSGKINTSAAEELWSESRSIREDYRDQINQANQRATRLEERVGTLEQRNNELMAENIELKRQVLEYEERVKRLQDRVAHLESENADLRQRMDRKE